MCYIQEYKTNYDDFLTSSFHGLMCHAYADSHAFAFSVQFCLQRSVTGDNGQSGFNFT